MATGPVLCPTVDPDLGFVCGLLDLWVQDGVHFFRSSMPGLQKKQLI